MCYSYVKNYYFTDGLSKILALDSGERVGDHVRFRFSWVIIKMVTIMIAINHRVIMSFPAPCIALCMHRLGLNPPVPLLSIVDSLCIGGNLGFKRL